jgi:hypothetical protein
MYCKKSFQKVRGRELWWRHFQKDIIKRNTMITNLGA